MDLLGIITGIGLGLVLGIISTFLFTNRILAGRGELKREKKTSRKVTDHKNLVKTQELERSRRELKTSLLEKEVLVAALTRVYEAETDGQITKDERENLSKKYRDQLKSIDGKLGDIEIFIEVGELERLHEELVNLFKEKIGNIETRLQDTSVKLDRLKVTTPPIIVKEVKTVVRNVEKKIVEREETKVDEKVKALRNEVLEALDRLEQMDIEG